MHEKYSSYLCSVQPKLDVDEYEQGRNFLDQWSST